MADTTITPNMNLPVPVPSTAPGPAWATNIVADMYAVDGHDHTSGKGVPITPNGLNINADLPLNENNLTEARTVRFSPQGAALADPADVGCLYEVADDLYYNDGAGNQVRITQGGAVTGATGTITGLPSGTASASYAGGTFTFESATSTPATMAVGPIKTGAAITSPFTVTVSASASMTANYALTYPVDAPTANQILVSDGSGNLSWTRGVLPLGSVIATFPNLTGAYSTSATTAADVNGFVKCNGQVISDATSPMNGQTVPNINNSIFIMGNTTAGTTGGSATQTLITNNLPSHTHGAGSFATSLSGTFGSSTHTHNMAHVHMWSGIDASLLPELYSLSAINDASTTIGTGDSVVSDTNNVNLSAGGSSIPITVNHSTGSLTKYYTTGALSAPSGSGSSAVTAAPSATASLSGSNNVTGTSGSTGSGTSFSILPPYITAVYLMRIK